MRNPRVQSPVDTVVGDCPLCPLWPPVGHCRLVNALGVSGRQCRQTATCRLIVARAILDIDLHRDLRQCERRGCCADFIGCHAENPGCAEHSERTIQSITFTKIPRLSRCNGWRLRCVNAVSSNLLGESLASQVGFASTTLSVNSQKARLMQRYSPVLLGARYQDLTSPVAGFHPDLPIIALTAESRF
jgi:hypothetical protein